MNNFYTVPGMASYPNYSNYRTPQPNYNMNYNPNINSMPSQNPADLPMHGIPYVTEEEAKAYIIMPNTKMLLMDRDKSVFYIKSADQLGKSTLEGFRYAKLEDEPITPPAPQIDTSEFVKVSDLDEKMKGFLTKEDLKNLDLKLEQLQRQIKANQILRGEEPSGQ